VPDGVITVLNAGANDSSAAARDDSVDVLAATEQLHNAAEHEAGHMLGNPDEYPTPAHPKGTGVEAGGDRMYRRHGGGAVIKRGSTTGVMSAGEEVLPQNHAAFAEAVARITGMPEWTA
jgi:hypothetical protein